MYYLELGALIYIVTINMITLMFFAMDKASAKNNWRRTPEKVLWLLALFGGSIGALLGMKLFRHKTKKLSFQLMLMLIILVQLSAIYGVNEFLLPNLLQN